MGSVQYIQTYILTVIIIEEAIHLRGNGRRETQELEELGGGPLVEIVIAVLKKKFGKFTK